MINPLSIYKTLFFLIGFFFSNSIFCINNFVLISAPGSGKGTFSQYLVEHHGYLQICPGDLFRHEIAIGSDLGIKIQPIVDRGDYVDEEIVCELIAKYVDKAKNQKKGFIIDGFPRSSVSFDFLCSLMEKYKVKKDTYILQFIASDNLCIDRILKRLVCTKCFKVYSKKAPDQKILKSCTTCGTSLTERKADTMAIVLKRLKYFHTHIEPLIQIAEKKFKVKKLQSEQTQSSLKAQYEKLLND